MGSSTRVGPIYIGMFKPRRNSARFACEPHLMICGIYDKLTQFIRGVYYLNAGIMLTQTSFPRDTTISIVVMWWVGTVGMVFELWLWRGGEVEAAD